MCLPHTFTVGIEPSRVRVPAASSGLEHVALDLGIPVHSDTPQPGLAVPNLPCCLVGERYGIEVVGPPRRVFRPDTA